MNISLYIPCFIDSVHPQVGMAVVKILEQLGHKVLFDPCLVCCGQPSFNSGYWEEARPMAIKTIERLKNAEVMVIPSGSCGAMIKKFYPELMAGTPYEHDAKKLASITWEFSDFLVNKLGVTDLGAKFKGKVTIHDGCHGLREMNLKQPIRRLLEKVEGAELIEMEDAESCCGFGGTFSAKFPLISTAMGEVKCASSAATGADLIVSNDSSCLMQIQGILSKQGSATRTMHLAELLVQK